MGAPWPHEVPQARALGRIPLRARLRAVANYYAYEVICTALAALAMAVTIAVALSACGFAKQVGGEVGGTAGEYIACPLGLFDCGHVFMCEQAADNELGHVEYCVNDDEHPEDLDALEALVGSCIPTPRHQGLCRWCFGPDCPRGCNAFSGCFEGAR